MKTKGMDVLYTQYLRSLFMYHRLLYRSLFTYISMSWDEKRPQILRIQNIHHLYIYREKEP